MATLLVIMPELAKVIMLYRKKISSRVSLFTRIKKELKNVLKAIVGSKEGIVTEKESMDAVKDSLEPENLEVNIASVGMDNITTEIGTFYSVREIREMIEVEINQHKTLLEVTANG